MTEELKAFSIAKTAYDVAILEGQAAWAKVTELYAVYETSWDAATAKAASEAARYDYKPQPYYAQACTAVEAYDAYEAAHVIATKASIAAHAAYSDYNAAREKVRTITMQEFLARKV